MLVIDTFRNMEDHFAWPKNAVEQTGVIFTMGKGVPKWSFPLRLSIKSFECVLYFLMYYGTPVASMFNFILVILKLLGK